MSFQSLRVWEKSKDLAVRIYLESKKSESLYKDFGFRDQLCRATVSIPSNVAEGYEMESNKHSIHHFTVTKGSCAELITQILIAQAIGYIPREIGEELTKEATHILAMLKKLIFARRRR